MTILHLLHVCIQFYALTIPFAIKICIWQRRKNGYNCRCFALWNANCSEITRINGGRSQMLVNVLEFVPLQPYIGLWLLVLDEFLLTFIAEMRLTLDGYVLSPLSYPRWPLNIWWPCQNVVRVCDTLLTESCKHGPRPGWKGSWSLIMARS